MDYRQKFKSYNYKNFFKENVGGNFYALGLGNGMTLKV